MAIVFRLSFSLDYRRRYATIFIAARHVIYGALRFLRHDAVR